MSRPPHSGAHQQQQLSRRQFPGRWFRTKCPFSRGRPEGRNTVLSNAEKAPDHDAARPTAQCTVHLHARARRSPASLPEVRGHRTDTRRAQSQVPSAGSSVVSHGVARLREVFLGRTGSCSHQVDTRRRGLGRKGRCALCGEATGSTVNVNIAGAQTTGW